MHGRYLVAVAVVSIGITSPSGGVCDSLVGYDFGRPMLIAGSACGIKSPHHIVGVGAPAMFHLEGIVHVQGTYTYGLVRDEGGDGGTGSDFFEIYAGFPLFNWEGT